MPSLRANGVDLHYVESGSGQQTVVFAHSYLVDHRQFDGQISALRERYRVIAFDHRDHGQSSRVDHPYSLDDIVRDAVAVIEGTDAAPCHFVGLSTGGFVGMRIALKHRELLRSVVLMDSSANSESSFNGLKYTVMFSVLGTLGVRPLLGTAMRLMFGRSSLKAESMSSELSTWRQRIQACDPSALIRFGRAITKRDDVLDALRTVEIPAMVIVGAEDKALPEAHSQRIADAIAGARLEVIPRVGHLNTIEAPEAVNALLLQFLDGVP